MSSLDLIDKATARPVLSDRGLVAIAWAIVALVLALSVAPGLIADGPQDTDAMMRLAEVRDLLAGQSWFDMTQWRMNAPDGLPMHWSRLIDLPIAGLILVFSGFASRATAETLAMIAWPLLLLGPYLFAVSDLARRLAGPHAALPGLAFAIFAVPVFASFTPGDIDHHNAQLVLTAWMVVTLIDSETVPARAALAGLFAAAMLSVGLEGLPMVALASATLAVAWIDDPGRFRLAAIRFGLTLPLALGAIRMVTTAPSLWLSTACDVASAPYLAIAAIGGFGLAALAASDPQRRWQRFAGLGGLAVAAAGAVALVAPRCLAGPYAEVDPRIVPIWLDHVEEAQSLARLVMDEPRQAFVSFLTPALAFGIAVIVRKQVAPERRFAWTMIAVLLGGAILVAAQQLRGSTFAALLAAPVCAAIVVHVRQRLEGLKPIPTLLGLVAAYLVPNQAFHARALDPATLAFLNEPKPSPAGAAATGSGRPDAGASGEPDLSDATLARSEMLACLASGTMAPATTLPPGIALTLSNLGPSVLAYTRHATVAGPYHRDAAGILDVDHAMKGQDADAARVIARRGIDYIFICKTDSPAVLLSRDRPDAFLSMLMAGHGPAWARELPSTGRLRMWAIDRDALAAATRLPSMADLRGTD